jgi:hypothetical protein
MRRGEWGSASEPYFAKDMIFMMKSCPHGVSLECSITVPPSFLILRNSLFSCGNSQDWSLNCLRSIPPIIDGLHSLHLAVMSYRAHACCLRLKGALCCRIQNRMDGCWDLAPDVHNSREYCNHKQSSAFLPQHVITVGPILFGEIRSQIVVFSSTVNRLT